MGKRKTKAIVECPCGGGLYARCCARYIECDTPAPTPEALMRSRYTAYALGKDDYILATWAPRTRPRHLYDAKDARPKWLRLEVLTSDERGDIGHVHFRATGRASNGAFHLREYSLFRRENGRWFYVKDRQEENERETPA